LHREGKLGQATLHYAAILKTQPDHADAMHYLGLIRFQQGRLSEGLDHIRAALKLNPDDAPALMNLGLILGRLSRPEEALARFDRALAIAPDYAEALNNRGVALGELKRAAEALASFGKAVAIRPDYAMAHYNRGNTLRDLNRVADALTSYEKALAIAPGFTEALNNQGNALRKLKRPEEALTSFDKALAIKPDYADALCNRGNVLRDLRRPEEALASYDKALVVRPDYIETLNNRGNALRELGRVDESAQAFETAIKLAPRGIQSYHNLTLVKRFAAGDCHLRAMEELARNMSSLGGDEQISLHFALAKALADIGDHQRSFQHLLSGNAVKRKQTPYDEAAALGILERTRASFTGALMGRQEGLGEPSAAPLFIFGMPRSGTTLIEQILATHPEVFGAGEIDDFAKAIAGLDGDAAAALRSPEVVSRMSGAQFRQLGAEYVRRVRAIAPAAARIANKTPGNFRLAGLIHLALPNARFIHLRRDPVDTCLSCFSRLFFGELPYAYDLGELGRYYRGYEALMAHWRKVLPPGVMLDVQYEDVTADLEGQARRILAHCALAWDPRCLDFHRNQRPVLTASATQVRQPIYNSSVGRSRPYEPFLTPLLEELNRNAGAGAG